MILIAMLTAAAAPVDECAESLSPYEMCIAEAQRESADADLNEVVEASSLAAIIERNSYEKWTTRGATSTFAADEIASLEVAQRIWRLSMEADCVLAATRFKTAFQSSVPLQQQLLCETQRIKERIAFLQTRYGLIKDPP